MPISTRVVISFANERGNYRAGIERLRQSLKGNYDGDFLDFRSEMAIGAPKHQDNPYAFKIYCWLEAVKVGYRQILWLDSSCFAIKNINPIFDVIEYEGYIMQEAGHMAGNWCNDFTLDYFKITREEAMQMPMYGNAGFLGLNLHKQPAIDFFHRWEDSMMGGCFKGSWENHRHDMVCGSIIANKLGMEYKKGDEWLEYATPGTSPKNETILIQAAGM